MHVRALCSRQLSTYGQLQRKLLMAGEAENDTSMWGSGLECFWIHFVLFWIDAWNPAPFTLFWKIDSAFTFHLQVVQFLDLFPSLGIDKNRLRSWGRHSSHIEGPATYTWSPTCFCGFFRLNSSLLGFLQGSSDNPKWAKVEREAQDRRSRGRLLMMV